MTQIPEDKDEVRAFYTDDRQEIINHFLRRMGKEPKSTPNP